jgi:uncharacterized delta-60 repeat protein
MRAVHVLFAAAMAGPTLACDASPEASASTAAAPPENVLDPAFGTNGIFTWGGTHVEAEDGAAVVRQADGKIVVATQNRSATNYVDLVRFTPAGAVDPTFGSVGTGHAVVPGISSKSAVSLATTPEGSLFVMGFTTVLEDVGSDAVHLQVKRAVAARLDANGALDRAWGTDGFVSVPANANESVASRLGAMNDGRLVIVVHDGSAAKVVRFDAAGKLDTTFGTAGVATISGFQFAGGLAFDSAGRILLGIGDTGPGVGPRGVVLRLRGDGTLDETFGGDGIARLSSTLVNVAALAVTTDGHVVAGGGSTLGARGSVVRLESSGVVDPTFNEGYARLTKRFVRDLAVDANGAIVVWSRQDVLRLDATGALDPTLAGTGTLDLPASPTTNGSILQPDGRLISAGNVASQVAVVRRSHDGSLDPTFGSGGIATASFVRETEDLAFSTETTADAKTIVRVSSDSGESHLLRLTPDGKLDTSFGVNGVAPLPVGAAAIDGAGRMLAIHLFNLGIVVQRYDSGGAVDPTFGAPTTPGEVGHFLGAIPTDLGIGVHPDGRIVIAGARGAEMFLIRTDARGVGDATFGKAGSVSIPIGAAFRLGRVTALADGGVVVAAVVDHKPAVIRVGPDGGPAFQPMTIGTVAVFGNADRTGVAVGESATSRPRVAFPQPNGMVVVLTTFDASYDGYRIERFDAHGRVDPTFGTGGGILNVETGPNTGHLDGGGPDLAVDDAGRMYVATVVADFEDQGRDHPAVFRYTPDGKPDATWGVRGRRLLPSGPGDGAARTIRLLADGALLVGGRIADGRMSFPDARSDAFVAKILP